MSSDSNDNTKTCDTELIFSLRDMLFLVTISINDVLVVLFEILLKDVVVVFMKLVDAFVYVGLLSNGDKS